MTKACSRCKEDKEITNFKKRSDRKESYLSWCIDCKRGYDRSKINEKLKNDSDFLKDHNAKNKKIIFDKNQFIKNYLLEHPCVDCGELDIEILDFDHKDRSEKEYSVSVMSSKMKAQKIIEAEIAKCDVRCGNCHRHKTMHESKSWRAAYCTDPKCKWKNI
jgi:hypothetical protein